MLGGTPMREPGYVDLVYVSAALHRVGFVILSEIPNLDQ